MSLFTNFHRFVVTSDFAAAGNGASSEAFVSSSDMGTLLMSLSSDKVYHVTQVSAHLHSVSDDIHVSICSLDSDGAAGSQTVRTIDYGIHTPAAPSGITTFDWGFEPPVRIQYDSNAHYIACCISVKDSDVEAAVSYNGFYTPAA